MITNDQELTVTLERIAWFQTQVAQLRKVETNPDNYHAAVLGFLSEIDRMQLEVREYLSLHPAEIETTACISRFPRMDGYETAKQIKKLEEHKTTPIVMVTASIERSALSQGFRSGAVVFMNKPFTAKKFLTVIQTIIR